MSWHWTRARKTPGPSWSSRDTPHHAEVLNHRPDLAGVVRRARTDPGSLTRQDAMVLQRMLGNRATARLLYGEQQPVHAASSVAGLPDHLRAGIERLSGLPMGDVRVRYGSPEPARVAAAAYACGSEIHVAPGREEHLPHEAWHVVQQKQGRVRPTAQVGGQSVNEDASLEREADLMGGLAVRGGERGTPVPGRAPGGLSTAGHGAVLQRRGDDKKKMRGDMLGELEAIQKAFGSAVQAIRTRDRNLNPDTQNVPMWLVRQFEAISRQVREAQSEDTMTDAELQAALPPLRTQRQQLETWLRQESGAKNL